jgi:hypothetical protein
MAQGNWLASLRPLTTLVLLQEANPNSFDALCAAAGFTWWHLGVDLRVPQNDDRAVRRRGVAIAGRGPEPTELMLLPELPLPERTMIARVSVGGVEAHVASYHAPPGVSWREKKAQQAVGFAQWLRDVDGPLLFGADANTPLVDAVDFAMTRTHWHTGSLKLNGEPGDDVLVGPGKTHRLEDALRCWLADHPEAMAEIMETRPSGPLRVSHRTGKRGDDPGTERHFDSIWVSPHFRVLSVAYPYEHWWRPPYSDLRLHLISL